MAVRKATVRLGCREVGEELRVTERKRGFGGHRKNCRMQGDENIGEGREDVEPGVTEPVNVRVVKSG